MAFFYMFGGGEEMVFVWLQINPQIHISCLSCFHQRFDRIAGGSKFTIGSCTSGLATRTANQHLGNRRKVSTLWNGRWRQDIVIFCRDIYQRFTRVVGLVSQICVTPWSQCLGNEPCCMCDTYLISNQDFLVAEESIITTRSTISQGSSSTSILLDLPPLIQCWTTNVRIFILLFITLANPFPTGEYPIATNIIRQATASSMSC